MRPHPRIRKTIKWGGLALCTLLIAACAISVVWSVGCTWIAFRKIHSVSLSSGRIGYASRDLPRETVIRDSRPMLSAEREMRPRLLWLPQQIPSKTFRITFVPLWLLCAIVMIPTAFASRLDLLATRRAKLGACPACSYSRTGLAPSSPCPECGSAAPQA